MSCSAKGSPHLSLHYVFINVYLQSAHRHSSYFSQLAIPETGIVKPPLNTEVKAYISWFNKELTANNTTYENQRKMMTEIVQISKTTWSSKLSTKLETVFQTPVPSSL